MCPTGRGPFDTLAPSEDPDSASSRPSDAPRSEVLLSDDAGLDPSLSRESSALFRALVDAAPDALLVADHAGSILLANRAAGDLFGYGPGELRGHVLEELLPASQRAAHAARWRRYLERPSARSRARLRDFDVLDREGCAVPVEIGLSSVTSPEGPLVIAIVRDLRARRAAEAQHRLKEAAAVGAASGILITDPGGRILWANPAFSRISGWAADDLVGKPTRVLQSGLHDASFYRDMWSTIREGRVWHGEIKNRRKDDGIYVEELTITPVLDDDGRITSFVASGADVTERRRAEAELRLVNERLLEELAEGAAFVRSVLPQPATLGGLSFDWVYQPSLDLGGDGLGFHVREDGKIALYLVDVCGHGLASALLSVAVITALRSGKHEHGDEGDPGVVLQSLNRSFRAADHGGLFFTLLYGVWDPTTRTLRLASAGHPPPVVVEAGVAKDAPGGHGPMIGLVDDAEFPVTAHVLAEGVQLYLFSDGAYELVRPDGTLLPYEHFQLAVETAARSSQPLDELVAFARAIRDPAPLDDDLSILRVTA